MKAKLVYCKNHKQYFVEHEAGGAFLDRAGDNKDWFTNPGFIVRWCGFRTKRGAKQRWEKYKRYMKKMDIKLDFELVEELS